MPSDTYEQALITAADLWGVEREYWDIWGQKHVAPAEDIRAVLESMLVPAGSKESLDQAMEARMWEEWSRLVPPTLVLSVHETKLDIRLPKELSSVPLRISIAWESGETEVREIPADSLEEHGSARLRETEFVAKRAPLPAPMRLGYHTLTVTAASAGRLAESSARLIICPDRAYFPEQLAGNGRAGGIYLSLYGLRSERNWGCGDFTDLKMFVEWTAKEIGASFVGLNPLHAIPNRQPYNTSPYLPLCTFYKNFIYLDIEAIPDFERSVWAHSLFTCPGIQNEIRELRESEFVEYERVHRLKLRFLKALFRSFLREEYRVNSERAREFRDYVEREGELLDQFATYCTLEYVMHKRMPHVWLWREWPPEYHDPNSPATREFARKHWRTVLFYKYVQWQIDVQLGAAQAHAKDVGLAIGLYHDLALATDRFGADLWAKRNFYVENSRVGAPPDDFAPNGQDWSFPPPNVEAHFRDGYRLFADTIRKNLRHGGALRIDHVMRFFHLFWIPGDHEAKRGLYVRDRHEDVIRILALESERNKVIIVGEDLGTVADEIREVLSRFGILSNRLFYFEKWKDGSFKAPQDYPVQALVSASTHDLPTLAGFWINRDIEARRAVGLIPDEESYRNQIRSRLAEKQKILEVLFRAGLLPESTPRSAEDIPELTGDLHNATVGFLASTPSALMMLGEEDLMKQLDQQNLPGTTAEYPNWRHKTRFTLEQMQSLQQAKDFAAMYRSWLAKTGRLNA